MYYPLVMNGIIHPIMHGGEHRQIVSRAVKNFINTPFGQFFDSGIYICIPFIENISNLIEENRFFLFTNRSNTPFCNRQTPIRNNFVHINFIDNSKTFTFRASTFRGIKREIMRSGLAIRDTCRGIHQMTGEKPHLLRVSYKNHKHSITHVHCSGNTL